MSKSESKYVEEMHLDAPDPKHGGHRHKKRKRVTCKQIIASIYDKKEGTIFNRTPKDWVFLVIFFLIFYVVLFGYFTLLLFIFIAGILSPNTPFRTGGNSLIGLSSTLAFNPVMGTTSLIDVSSAAKRTAYLDQVDKFLALNLVNGSAAAACDPNSPNTNINSPCPFDSAVLGPCLAPRALGNQSVCVYLRVNNVFGWLPDVSNSSLARDILLSCSGKTPADSSNMGQILFYPSRPVSGATYGIIPSMYYPFLNQSGYQPPIVAVYFSNLTRNVAVSVSCFTTNLRNVNSLAAFSLYIL